MFSKSNLNTLKLLRIPFSLLLMPVFLLALSESQNINVFKSIVVFIVLHVLVYPASNGYNSYIDKDESSIGGLEKPPMPTKQLFYVTIFLDLMALFLSLFFIHLRFAICVVLYIIASRAYSSPQIRLKKHPFLGFLTVVIFQGGFTYYLSIIGINETYIVSKDSILVLLACSFQIAGAYPLTQIYQHSDDLKAGVTTISYKLGIRGTFYFTIIMFAICNVLYYIYFLNQNKEQLFIILQLFFLPIVVYFFYWFYRTMKNKNEANFKNTMRMNLISAICMNCCFILFYFINN